MAVSIVCRYCNTNFKVPPSRIREGGNFCHQKCYGKWRVGKEAPMKGRKNYKLSGEGHWNWQGGRPSCQDCGIQLAGYSSKRCKKCSGLTRRGKNHWNWKEGKMKLDYLERRRFRHSMQKQVFERDSYTCQICGTKRDLQVDHIQAWAEYVALRFSIDNCRTLCKRCHYQITFGKPMPTKVESWGHNLERGTQPFH